MIEYIHKMVLGTAQLSMKYGIANKSRMPTKSESLNILETAWKAGVRYFDTAPGYHSESLIGEFVRSERIQNEIRILTKIPTIGDYSDWQNQIVRSIANSLASLKCDYIEVLFFHSPRDSNLLHNREFFRDLLTKFPIKSLGISVYEPDEVEMAKNCGIDLAFQFPFNLLDKRFEKNTLSMGKRYARSILLQGFLASQELIETAPDELKRIHKLIIEDCHRNNISLIQQAFKFAVESSCLDFFLVGVESIAQLRQLFNLDLNIDINVSIIEKWRSLITNKFLDPRKWN